VTAKAGEHRVDASAQSATLLVRGLTDCSYGQQHSKSRGHLAAGPPSDGEVAPAVRPCLGGALTDIQSDGGGGTAKLIPQVCLASRQGDGGHDLIELYRNVKDIEPLVWE